MEGEGEREEKEGEEGERREGRAREGERERRGGRGGLGEGRREHVHTTHVTSTNFMYQINYTIEGCKMLIL